MIILIHEIQRYEHDDDDLSCSIQRDLLHKDELSLIDRQISIVEIFLPRRIIHLHNL